MLASSSSGGIVSALLLSYGGLTKIICVFPK